MTVWLLDIYRLVGLLCIEEILNTWNFVEVTERIDKVPLQLIRRKNPLVTITKVIIDWYWYCYWCCCCCYYWSCCYCYCYLYCCCCCCCSPSLSLGNVLKYWNMTMKVRSPASILDFTLVKFDFRTLVTLARFNELTY